jgi:5'-3' exonuclease
MLEALIDADILQYEVSFAAEYGWKTDLPPFDYVEQMLLERIGRIQRETSADSVRMFFTGKTNFRNEIATERSYKGTRVKEKPYHYKNVKAYLQFYYEWEEQEGLEADDLLCIYQTERLQHGNTIICSRDKDLKQCPGWHYTWECGKQGSWGPCYVEGLGDLWMKGNKLHGTGPLFFYAQCLMGDNVDNIPGLRGYGDIKSNAILSGLTSEKELEERVLEAYTDVYGPDEAKPKLLEQARLLYMIRKLDKEGKPIMWEFKECGG